jgi:Predicted nucleotide-binding protein containing TIR-like domain
VTILHERPNGSETIVEKFETHAGAAGFAVVVLTPGDEGGPAGGQLRPRARQNVVGEMFWFVGKLGRKRVCTLRKGDVEIPSDFVGLVYTDMDERGAWKHDCCASWWVPVTRSTGSERLLKALVPSNCCVCSPASNRHPAGSGTCPNG